jgi:hypothetical protein
MGVGLEDGQVRKYLLFFRFCSNAGQNFGRAHRANFRGITFAHWRALRAGGHHKCAVKAGICPARQFSCNIFQKTAIFALRKNNSSLKTYLQTCNPVTLQPRNPVTPQPCNPATL